MIGASLEGLERQHIHTLIVGSGPAGLTLALELARLGQASVLLESGLVAPGPAQDLSAAAIVDPRRHDDMAIAVARRLGGTSNLWGGRSMPLDPVDFLARDFALQRRWPIAYQDLAPWYPAACRYTHCGEPEFDLPLPGMHAASDEFSFTSIERASNKPRFQLGHKASLASDPRIDIRLGATVVELLLADSGRLRGVVAAGSDGVRRTLAADRVVIAAGGLESTRLLLATRRAHPSLFGGPDGPLGRYYMGHIIGEIADIVFRDGRLAAAFDFILDGRGSYARRRFVPSPALQQAHGLPNVCFWPVVPPVADARHRSGSLSAVAMALSTPVLGSMLIPEAIRSRHVPDHIDWLPHLRNVALDLPGTVGFLGGFMWKRYLASQRIPGYFVRNRAHRYGLSYHSEQSPRADSRVSLGAEVDRLGLPRLVIDLRFHREDAEALVRAHEQLRGWLAASGFGELEYRQPVAANVDAVLAQASHGTHQIGTARMGFDRQDGVVDGDLRCFDIPNLFVASSAVFPTSSQANPTLTIVALAVRLAATLAAESAGGAPAAGAASERRRLPDTDLRLPRLAFGTAFLFNAGSAARRQSLLAAARDQGFSHFDTSPCYGFGVAERDLAALLRADPRLTVTSKVGLHGPGGDDQGELQVLLRKVGGKLVRSLAAARSDFQLAHAQRSLEGSLRRLGRDCIDLYLLHQPTLALLDGAAWLDWLQSLQRQGKIRHFGIEVDALRLPAFLASDSPLAALIQLDDALEGPAAGLLAARGRRLQLSCGEVSRARAAGNRSAERDLLDQALARNAGGTVVVDTLNQDTLAHCGRLLRA